MVGNVYEWSNWDSEKSRSNCKLIPLYLVIKFAKVTIPMHRQCWWSVSGADGSGGPGGPFVPTITFCWCRIWQYRLCSFKFGDTKLEIFFLERMNKLKGNIKYFTMQWLDLKKQEICTFNNKIQILQFLSLNKYQSSFIINRMFLL